MPGKKVTNQQEKMYMSLRLRGNSQKLATAKAGFCERTGRNIEHNSRERSERKERHWRTRKDPFSLVWESELVPLLESAPLLSPITLLEHLQSRYEGQYPDKLLRSLERRVKKWKALSGSPKEVMFRQCHEPGLLGLSDFSTLKDIVITIQGKPFSHLLYHFRLACSGWSHVKVIIGGESFTALAEGLQEALWRLGGAPLEHRTDSLSAAFKNLTADEKEDMTKRYETLCEHYHIKASRNNRGISHENGSIESPHGHIKRRIKQALLLRVSTDFDSKEDYQTWVDTVVNQHNRRNAKGLAAEHSYLQALPKQKSIDFTEVCARVSSSSTIDVRRATYTVPSRLEGENLRIHLYHDRLECYLGATHVITLTRVYASGKTERVRNIDYRHVIHSLVKKPEAFRYSQLRDDLLPNQAYKAIWQHVDQKMPGKLGCKFMVGLLYLAAQYDCEAALAKTVLARILDNQALSLIELQKSYVKSSKAIPLVNVIQHNLASYNALLPEAAKEMFYG
jgi:transposase InsO family protein